MVICGKNYRHLEQPTKSSKETEQQNTEVALTYVPHQKRLEQGEKRKRKQQSHSHGKTDAECDTHRKTPNKTIRNAEVNTFLHSAARRLGHFFAIKHRKNRCESKSKVQFRVSKVPKLEFQHMPAQESHHPARRQTQRLPTFWEVFWSLARKPEFCVVFVKKTMFLTLKSSLSCFLVRFLRKCRKYHAFRL